MHGRWLVSPQLFKVRLRQLVWIGMPLGAEELGQSDIEGRQNGFDGPDASQQLLVHDLFTRIGVEMLPVHNNA